MRKKLCYQASDETRNYAEDLKLELLKIQPEISNVLVPNCIYRCGCPEMKTCGHFNKWLNLNPKISSTNIQERYEAYNELFRSDNYD